MTIPTIKQYTPQERPYHVYLFIGGAWIFDGDYLDYFKAEKSATITERTCMDVEAVKIVKTLNYNHPQPAPAIEITLDDIEIVQLELFCGITDTYLEFFDYTQPIPATITAPTLPELMRKLSTAGFSLDTTLSNLTAMEGLNS